MTEVPAAIAQVHLMDQQTWERHANPMSVWTRYASFPFLIAAVWSRVWIGWWALVPVAVVMAWLWLNPRVFSRPQSTDNWASKAVLGERVYLARREVPIPDELRPSVMLLLSGVPGLALLTWGLVTTHLLPTIAGGALVLASKTWFNHRMVRLYDAMRQRHAPYAAWLY